MAISISGGVHLGGDDTTPYLNVHLGLGSVANIDLSVGPNGVGLAPGSSVIGSLLDVLPAPLPATIGSAVEVVNTVVAALPVEQITTAVGNVLDLGGTVVNLSLGVKH